MVPRLLVGVAGMAAGAIMGVAAAVLLPGPPDVVPIPPQQKLVWGWEMYGGYWAEGTDGRFETLEACKAAVMERVAQGDAPPKPHEVRFSRINRASCIRYSGYEGYMGQWDWTGGTVLERVWVFERPPPVRETPT
jgi:hypothetical protein